MRLNIGRQHNRPIYVKGTDRERNTPIDPVHGDVVYLNFEQVAAARNALPFYLNLQPYHRITAYRGYCEIAEDGCETVLITGNPEDDTCSLLIAGHGQWQVLVGRKYYAGTPPLDNIPLDRPWLAIEAFLAAQSEKIGTPIAMVLDENIIRAMNITAIRAEAIESPRLWQPAEFIAQQVPPAVRVLTVPVWNGVPTEIDIPSRPEEDYDLPDDEAYEDDGTPIQNGAC